MDRQKLITTILIVLEAGLLCGVLIFSMFFNTASATKEPATNKQSEHTANGDESENSQSTEGDTTNSESEGNAGNWFASETRETFSEAVEQKLDSMTTEQKVAQLFIISPEALTGVERVTISGNATRDALNQYPVGGLVYSQQNFMGQEQAESLINGAQGHSQNSIGLPLFVVVNEDAPDYMSFATLSMTLQDRGALAIEIGEAPAIPNGIQTCTYTSSIEVVAAIKGGMNMIYAPENFVETYEAVLEAVNDGTISQVRLENAVGSVLSEKLE